MKVSGQPRPDEASVDRGVCLVEVPGLQGVGRQGSTRDGKDGFRWQHGEVDKRRLGGEVLQTHNRTRREGRRAMQKGDHVTGAPSPPKARGGGQVRKRQKTAPDADVAAARGE